MNKTPNYPLSSKEWWVCKPLHHPRPQHKLLSKPHWVHQPRNQFHLHLFSMKASQLLRKACCLNSVSLMQMLVVFAKGESSFIWPKKAMLISQWFCWLFSLVFLHFGSYLRHLSLDKSDKSNPLFIKLKGVKFHVSSNLSVPWVTTT